MTRKTVRRKGYMLFLTVLFASALTACGSSNTAKYAAPVADTVAPAVAAGNYPVVTVEAAAEYDDEYDGGTGMSYEMPYAEEAGALEQQTSEVTEAAATERKLIKTVDISAETEQFDTLLPFLQAQVEKLGGYIEEISIYDNDSYDYENRVEKLRCANMTARVPKDGLDSFLAQVGEQSNVVRQSESVEDVTLRYVDLDSHKRVLVSEQERLIELLARAETVEDIITIEERLSEVRYQIESMESQLRTYDNKIDYSTVYLYVNEVKKYTPSQDITVWERIGNGFVNSLEDIGNGFCDFFIRFIINIPYIVLWGIIIVVAVLAVRKIIRIKSRKTREKTRGKWFRRKKKTEAVSDTAVTVMEKDDIQTEQEEKEEHGE